MSDFAAAARGLAGLAGALLGWRAEDFWGATPAELAVVVEALTGGEAEGLGTAELARLMGMFPDARG